MIYFINEGGNVILAYDPSGKQILEEFRTIAKAEYTPEQKQRLAGGGQLQKEKKKYKKRKVSEDLDDLEEPKETKKGRGNRLLPEALNKIKIRINEGIALKEIAEEFEVSYQTIYVLKKKMEERAKDTIPG